jgi:hypothetical protein
MVMIVWNTQGFHLIDAMLRGEIGKILTPIWAQLMPTERRKLVVHADNP